MLIWIRSEERQRQVESLHQVTSLMKINPAVIFLWHFWCSWVYPIALGRPTAYCWTMIVHWDNWHRPVCFMLFNTTSTTQLTTVTCSCLVSVALEPCLHYWLYSSSSYIYLKGPQINLCVSLHHNHPMKSVIPEILSLPFLSIFFRQNYSSFHFLTVSITPASAFWGLYFQHNTGYSMQKLWSIYYYLQSTFLSHIPPSWGWHHTKILIHASRNCKIHNITTIYVYIVLIFSK